MPSVLFVCTANICRSPLAQGLWLLQLNCQTDNWWVESAGTWAIPGLPPSQHTLQILRERGIDLSTRRSIQVDAQLMQSFALILTMENGQKEALQIEFPQHKHKVYLLSEMIGKNYEIADPMGGNFETYRQTAVEIENILKQGYQTIVELSSK